MARAEDKLRQYQALWEGGELGYRPHDPLQLDLRLAGAAVRDQREEGAFLVVCNQIIFDHFDISWIKARFQQLFTGAPPKAPEPQVQSTDDSELGRLTAKVDRLFCQGSTDTDSPYRWLGPGTELIGSTLYLFPMTTVEDSERVALQVFVGIEGLGGQLWEQEVRALVRLNTRRHDTLPTIREGGYYEGDGEDIDDNGKLDLAYIVTDAGKETLAEPNALECFRSEKVEALRQLNLLAEGLAILHGSGLMHRNLHPGTVEVVFRDMEGKDLFLRMSRFEMAPLIANLLRRLDPRSRPDDEDPESAKDLRAYFLDQGNDALACLAPEQLAHIFRQSKGGAFEGANADVFSLGVIAYQWFVGQLPQTHLQTAFAHHTYHDEDWQRLYEEMQQRIRRAPIHARLRKLLEKMLEANPRTRFQAAEVVDYLVRHFDTIARRWEERDQNRRYLVAYLADEIGYFLRRYGFLHGDPRSPTGRAELHRFLAQDLSHSTLSFAPAGCAALVRNPDDRHTKSRYVLRGARLIYFTHLYEERTLQQRTSHAVPQVLIIRFSVEETKAHHINPGSVQRQLPAIELVSHGASALDLESRAGRPSWEPLLESVERATESLSQQSFLDALDWLLRLNKTRLDARTYAVDVSPDDPFVLVLDETREQDWLTTTDLGALFYYNQRLRPDFASFFEQEADKTGNLQLAFVPDLGGAPNLNLKATELRFECREGNDAIRVEAKSRLKSSKGWLQLADDDGSRYQLEQQRRARFRLAGMPELVHQLQYPSTPARIRQRWPDAGRGLDGKAPEIIRKLLDSRPIFALQGPPGTGKTTVIAEAVQQCLDRDRNTRILIAAQSHYALDNLAERIHDKLQTSGMGDVDALRIVSPKSKDRDFPTVVRGYFIERLVEGRKRLILKHCDERLEYGPPPERVAPNAGADTEPEPHRRGHNLSEQDLIRRWRRVIEGGEMELHDRLRRGANLVFCTTGTATDTYLGTDREDGFDWVIVDEAAKAWPTELVMPLVHGQRWALVGGHKQLGPFNKNEVEQVLDKCLNHELEELRRVGERKEAYRKVYELFKNLIEGNPDDARTGPSGYLEQPVEVLDEQFRMHPAISDLISQRFYGDALKPAEVTSKRRHGIEGCDWLHERTLVWVDTSDSREAPESGEPRWHNPKEVEIILEILGQLGDTRNRTVVLSPYNAQLKQLRDRVRDDFRERLYTVDAFQGREADIVIVSMVRCNEAKPDALIKRLGFLIEEERVNVLFSRARALLIVVGSFNQFYESESGFWPKLCGQIQAGNASARVDYREVLDTGDKPAKPEGKA